MQVLFTDIDGVLNCSRTSNARKLPYVVDAELLSRFEKLVRDIGLTVVLTSTWRYDPAGLFSAKHWGIPFADVVPDMPGKPRRDEILAWLSEHREVSRFAVLDDDDDELDELPLFQPSPRSGLSDEICSGLKSYFAGASTEDMRRSGVIRLLQKAKAAFKGHKG